MVFRSEDYKPDSHLKKRDGAASFCGLEQLEWNTSPLGALARMDLNITKITDYQDTSLVGNYINLKKRVYKGCPSAKKVLYMGVVMDCTYIASYGSSEKARQRVIDNWNTASRVFEETFNIYLGLYQIVDLPNCGDTDFNLDCSDSYTISRRLNDFSRWRGTTQDNSAGLWHLMSNCR
jgi:hypothetical protein